ncbi:CapA family protein [Lederbergia citrea]|uniref:CapA family protein n=1 Tax=Lederbergia citrea TaxID=2833581 RepID=A0A942Z1U5_9BACI|nr:CapA family protein [Lederbergia citrea]MBS4221848.1 CapA family protein [Lederbergia citrea]
MKPNKSSFAIIAILLLLAGIGVLITHQKKISTTPNVSPIMYHQKKLLIEPKHYESEVVIGGIGDILIHDWVYEDAKTKNGYDFNPMFDPVRSMLQKPDFLIANQESVPGGTEIGISNYPSFNSPHEIVDALMEAGVDMVTTANNHALDRGEKAILSAISYYEKKYLPYAGTYKSPQDKENMRIISINGIRMAILPYATHTNGIPIPEGKDYLVNMLDKDKVLADIQQAKTKADFIILALHWGDEYQREPNETQKQLAHEFIKAGADLILGHHPHVLQPMEWIEKSDGQKGLVVYSLGNFLSGQLWDYKDIGGMVEVTVKKEYKDEESNTFIQKASLHPTFTASKQFRTYRVYPLDEAKEKGLTTHSSKEIQEFFESNR